MAIKSKQPDGRRFWLTVPVQVKGRLPSADRRSCWSPIPVGAVDHWKTLTMAYGAAPYFNSSDRERFERAYDDVTNKPRLSAINGRAAGRGLGVLGISTKLTWSTDYGVEGARPSGS